MSVQARPKTGGRVAGVPNRATRELKKFLQGVFHEALIAGPDARKALVESIQKFSIEPAILRLLLNYAYGAPSREVDVRHQGQVSLAQLVSGSALEAAVTDEDDDEEEWPPTLPPVPPQPAPDGPPQ